MSDERNIYAKMEDIVEKPWCGIVRGKYGRVGDPPDIDALIKDLQRVIFELQGLKK